MDIFQQSINLPNQKKEENKKFNDLQEAQEIKEIKKEKKNKNKNKNKNKKNQIKDVKKIKNIEHNKFNYSKLNIKTLQISCKKLYDLQNKPFQPFINYIKEFSDNIIFLSNNYFNDLFYIKNNLLYLPVENSFIIAFIELNFFNYLDNNGINYYCLDFFCNVKIPRNSITYINKKVYLKEPLDIRNCFLCPYFDFKNQKCTL